MSIPTVEARCEKSDLYVSQCAHCRGHVLDLDVDPDAPVITARFRARFPGVCPNCEWEYGVGDLIGRTADGARLCERCLP